MAGCAPTVLNRLLAAAGAAPVETEPDVEGAQLKVNMLLTRLPRLRDASVDPAAAFAGTFHINEGYGQLEQTYAARADGSIPDLPPVRDLLPHPLGPLDPRSGPRRRRTHRR